MEHFVISVRARFPETKTIDRIDESECLQVMGRLSPMVWSAKNAFGVHFYCQSLNATRRRRTDSVDAKRSEKLVQRVEDLEMPKFLHLR